MIYTRGLLKSFQPPSIEIYISTIRIMKKVKAILEDELLNGEVVKKWSIVEVSKSLAEYLVRAYNNRWQIVEEDVKAEVKEEKKSSKKSK